MAQSAPLAFYLHLPLSLECRHDGRRPPGVPGDDRALKTMVELEPSSK